VDITTGEANRLANLQDRYLFAFMWVDGEEEPQVDFLRGDVNNDQTVTITDVTALIDILLTGDTAPAIADCNNDNGVTITDVTALIDYLLTGAW
jgi:hypothetical protein